MLIRCCILCDDDDDARTHPSIKMRLCRPLPKGFQTTILRGTSDVYQYENHQHLKRVTFGIFVILYCRTHVCRITLKWLPKKMPSSQYKHIYIYTCLYLYSTTRTLYTCMIFIYEIGNHGILCCIFPKQSWQYFRSEREQTKRYKSVKIVIILLFSKCSFLL